jgi:hypothetical protein
VPEQENPYCYVEALKCVRKVTGVMTFFQGDAMVGTGVKRVVTYGKFLLIEGGLQNQENVISVKADIVRSLETGQVDVRSHDFY